MTPSCYLLRLTLHPKAECKRILAQFRAHSHLRYICSQARRGYQLIVDTAQKLSSRHFGFLVFGCVLVPSCFPFCRILKRASLWQVGHRLLQ